VYACQTWWYHRVFFTFAGALADADLSRAMAGVYRRCVRS
jgi:hypothetical protein